ncbi:hypothetical protein [Allomuricauda sp. M10]|uniref:hypothetical protein n=1 Tax=Allomuricauda sp. M10 TaxID=2683292 RepID=UPI001D18B4A4|nr:hypothetical protein [Muricauda sp. M10]
MRLKEKMRGFNELAAVVKDFSLKLLLEQYENGSCQLGNNGSARLSERESFFTVNRDEFGDERINLIQSGIDEGYPYYLAIETNGNLNSKYEIGLMLDDLEENLSKQMIEDLDEEFYKFYKNFSED